MSSSSMEESTDGLLGLEASFYEVSVSFLLWGLHLALASYAIHLLCERGLRQSFPRQCLSGIVLLMLGASTVYVILMLKFYIMQIPSMMEPEVPPALLRRLKEYNIAQSWLSRLNFCLSDLIVVWRAWALWPGKRLVRWMLGISMAGTSVSTTVYAVLLTVDSFRVELPNGSNDLLLPASALRALLYIPLMSTNVFATLLICYKAWLNRQNIRSFTISSTSDERTATFASSFKTGRILALLVETGALYIAFMTINIVNSFGTFNNTTGGYLFGTIWSSAIMEISAIYPTIIIIFVSKFMSQDAPVYSYPMAYRSEGSPPGNTQLGRAQGANGSSTVSAISTISTKQFDRPQIATQTFSIVCEGRDDESSKGLKPGMLTVV